MASLIIMAENGAVRGVAVKFNNNGIEKRSSRCGKFNNNGIEKRSS